MTTLDTLPDDIIEKISEKIDSINLYNFSEVFPFLKTTDYYNDYYNNIDKADWKEISKQKHTLSENFIRKFKKKVNWEYISEHQELSEDFIKKFKHKVDWNNISHYQKLSENFITDYEDKVCWEYIFKYQELSEDFVMEFQDKFL